MRTFLWLLTSAIVFVTVVGVLSRAAQQRNPSDSDGWVLSAEVKPRPMAGLAGSYDVAFDAVLSPDGRIRLLLHEHPDGTAHFVDLQPDGVQLGLLEAGIYRNVLAEQKCLLAGKYRVRLMRRGIRYVLLIDGKLAAQMLRDEGEGAGGRLRVLTWRKRAKVTGFKLRPVEETIQFADDFMRSPGEAGDWLSASGKWELRARTNPSLSANAFAYAGSGPKALALAGRKSWTCYDFSASVRAPDNAPFGLVFAVTGEGDYYLFRTRARSDGNVRQLVHVVNEKEQVVASSRGGHFPGQWYRMKVEFRPGKATCFLDGHEVLSGSDRGITRGRVGLWTDAADADKGGTVFDDVVVSENAGFEDSFDEGCQVGAAWSLLGGRWQVNQGKLLVETPEEAKALCGSDRWRDASVRAYCRKRRPLSAVGLVVSYRDETDFVLFSIEKKLAKFEKVNGDRSQVLDERDLPQVFDSGLLEVRADKGHYTCLLDGEAVLEGWLPLNRVGRCGLWVAGSACFDAAAVSLPVDKGMSLGGNRTFGSETSMSVWADVENYWYSNEGSRDETKPRWYRTPVFGDCEMSVEFDKEPGGAGEFVLSLAKSGSPDVQNNGYSMRTKFERQKPQGTALTVSFIREGKEVRRREFQLAGFPRDASLRRAGSFIVGSVNGRECVTIRDPSPLPSAKSAWYSKGLSVRTDHVALTSPNMLDYSFNRAPVDWRVGEGVWEITSRWVCDQRWSFLAGYPTTLSYRTSKEFEEGKIDPEKAGAAILWNKRRFKGDVCVELYAGIKMDSGRDRRYKYARDINVTICADGGDLTTGYSCLFGGFNNSKSCIARGREVVQENTEQTIQRAMQLHRKWFYVRVEKRGGKIEYSVDYGNIVSLEYEDPEPLEGGYVAIWSYDCGMMVSRVRISSRSVGEMEPPEFAPESTPDTIYRHKARENAEATAGNSGG